MNKLVALVLIIILFLSGIYLIKYNPKLNVLPKVVSENTEQDPLSIEAMRKKDYPGSQLAIEQVLEDGSNYHQYIASYMSEGLKINGLLTIPIGNKPSTGWPVIIFNHGYIAPTQYRTTERYVSYVDAFARNGYIVFKSDYRGHGSSEGTPEGAYYSPSYTVDVLNAVASVKKYTDADPNRIGMWGHSMGGNITLRNLVVKPSDIKAAVIWGGVVGTYDDLLNNWHRVTYSPPPDDLALRNKNRQNLINKFGTPKTNPNFWNSIDPNSFLGEINVPVQIHSGEEDEEVPVDFSKGLDKRLKDLGKTSELYIYPGDNHNISGSFDIAMERSIEFFNKYLHNPI